MTTRLRTRDGSCTLYSARYAQAYGSQHGALTEAQEVFLAPSGVAARLASGEVVRVLEVGFGTGLNFFVTARAALAAPGAQLHYTALERDLLSAAEVAALGYGELLGEGDLLAAYSSWRAGLTSAAGVQRFLFPARAARVTLELHLGDAAALAATGALPRGPFRAVYQDAFSPEANPELWTPDFLEALTSALEPGGTLTSYCVKGVVRRRLAALGLTVSRRPGPPGGKREVLLARRWGRAPELG